MSLAILFKDSGELGNRLITYSYLLGFGARHRVRVENLCFWRYGHLFAKREDRAGAGERVIKGLLGLPGWGRIRRRFQFDGGLVCAPRAIGVRLMNAGLSRWAGTLVRPVGLRVREELVWGHDCSFVVSRDLADLPIFEPSNVTENSAKLRERFALRPDLEARVTAWVKPIRERYDRLIGVHVRRGDYAVFRGGRWFYDYETYRALMSHLMKVFAPERVGFVVASPETFQAERWAGLPVHAAGPGVAVLEMYALARCDLIVGPPSSFSGWASFMGNRPIFYLEKAGDRPKERELGTVWTPRYY